MFFNFPWVFMLCITNLTNHTSWQQPERTKTRRKTRNAKNNKAKNSSASEMLLVVTADAHEIEGKKDK